MQFAEYTAKTADQAIRALDTAREGLSGHEVLSRQQKFGPNKLSATDVHWWQILLRQFKSPFLYLLIGASVLAFFLGEKLDGLMIFLFVGINAALGFYQEYKSEKTLLLLKQYVVAKSKVYRDKKEQFVPSDQLVPGDIVLFEPGDVVACDIRIIDSENLFADESILTGESVSVQKTSDAIRDSVHDTYKAVNILFSGTTIVSGEGRGVIIGIGKDTVIGNISTLTAETAHESSFEKGIAKFSKFILQLIVVTLIFIILINIAIKGNDANIPTLLIFAIALAVSVIPEALPIVITFSLSRGALNLAKHKVVVKRLSAIEDLGSIRVLCTDKTGTITENKLTVKDTYPKKSNVLAYAWLAAAVHEKAAAPVDAFDKAIADALTEDDRKFAQRFTHLSGIPFDPERKRNSVVVVQDSSHELIVRGAAEAILPLCTDDAAKKRAALAWAKKEGESGKRAIAVARKPIQKKSTDNDVSQEKNLEFVGLISFIDPLKKTAQEAIVKAKILGVQIKILTGDSKDVAGNIAYTVGLISDPLHVLTGEAFDSLSTQEQHEAVDGYAVFARIAPSQKHKIINLLKEKYEVGFLGEGINDAPALKAAHVAMAVAGASDIAREASDIVLLNKSLHVIVDGIMEGRKIFANTTKYIKATLASNFGNFYTVAIASLFIDFLPLLPLQILLINLLTDFPMIAVATDNVDKDELKSPREYGIREIALFATIMGIVSSFFDFIFFVLFYKISAGVLQTNWFIASVVTELVFLFAIRTRFSVFRAKGPSRTLFFLSVFAFIIALVLPFTRIGHTLFDFITPSTQHIYLILFITVLYFIASEGVKLMYYRLNSNKERK